MEVQVIKISLPQEIRTIAGQVLKALDNEIEEYYKIKRELNSGKITPEGFNEKVGDLRWSENTRLSTSGWDVYMEAKFKPEIQKLLKITE